MTPIGLLRNMASDISNYSENAEFEYVKIQYAVHRKYEISQEF